MKQFGMIKKALVFVLSFGLLAGLAACGDKATSQPSDGATVPSGGSEVVASQPVGGNTGAPVQGEESWFRYTDVNEGVGITDYLGEEASIIIPSTLAGKAVVAIKESAFASKGQLVSITIPDSVLEVEKRAFFNCENLEYVNQGNGIKKIGDEVFFMCPQLTEMIFSPVLEEAGEGAFGSCPLLNKVEIPTSMHTAGESLFVGSGIVEVTIPAGLKKVGERFLQGSLKLEKVIIEEGITDIGYEAFDNCPSLQEVYIPTSVTEIDVDLCKVGMEFTIVTPAGSAAEAFAVQYDFPYRNE